VQCYGFWNFKSGVVERFSRRYILCIVTAELKTASVAYFQRKIQLLGFSAYPDASPSQSTRIIGVLLYLSAARTSASADSGGNDIGKGVP